MRLEDRRDPSDLTREFAVRHDRKLRPERSSSWLAVPILSIVFLGAALIATGTSIFPTRPPTKPKAAVTEPGPKKSSPIADEERIDRVAPQPRQRLVKCLGARGVTAYTDGTCPAGSQPTPMNDRPTLSIADGMTVQQRKAVQEANQLAARQVLEHELRVAQNVDRTSDECRALDAAIATYDAEARQPLSAWRQDRLRILRQEARGRQFALRCQ